MVDTTSILFNRIFLSKVCFRAVRQSAIVCEGGHFAGTGSVNVGAGGI
jgi:hypothetical protein